MPLRHLSEPASRAVAARAWTGEGSAVRAAAPDPTGWPAGWRAPRGQRLARAGRVLALAACLPLVAPPAPAQGWGVPVPASVALVPLLVLLVPLGMVLSRDDAQRVQALEHEGDLAALIQLASRRLAAQPDHLHWRELRGRAWMRRGRCATALADLTPVLEARLAAAAAAAPSPPEAAALVALGLARARCAQAGGDTGAAVQTLTRLVQAAAARWEPVHERALLLAARATGDPVAQAVAQREVEAALRVLDGLAPAAAADLARRAWRPSRPAEVPAAAVDPAVAAGGRGAGGPGDTQGDPAGAGEGPIPGAAGRLLIGQRGLALPTAAWQAGPPERGTATASGRRIQPGSAGVVPVPLSTAGAWARTAAGELESVLAFTAPARQAWGVSRWVVDDPCPPAPGSLLRERPATAWEQPECLQWRRLPDWLDGADAALAPVLAAAQAGRPAEPAGPGYELRYAAYGWDWAVEFTWRLPAWRLSDTAAALPWARAVADALRPLAREGGHPQVLLPAPPVRPGSPAPAAPAQDAAGGATGTV